MESSNWQFPKIMEGYHSRDPNNKDHRSLGSILGPLLLGNYQLSQVEGLLILAEPYLNPKSM